ncbi:MAG: alpha/beta hydrolase [Protaetiibacter sp.]
MPLAAPVRGGELRGAVWEPDAPAIATVLAVHGITSSHLAWRWLADALPGVRVVAPDLRGRGRSRELSGPWGMEQHAEDCAAFLDAAGASEVVAIGHSMGGFVAGALAALAPRRIAGLVLVDGGLPLPAPAGVAPAELPEALIGPAAARLSAVYPSREAYREFWRAHPAFEGVHDPRLDEYADYELRGEAPELRPAARIEAVAADSLELQDETAILDRLRGIRGRIPFLRAERGLLDEVPPLYPWERLDHWRGELPALEAHAIDSVNHYTILMSDDGVRKILPVIERAIGAPAEGVHP